MRSIGGEIYGITSQNDEAAKLAKTTWGIGFDSRADPKIEIGKCLKERGLLNIFVNTDPPPPALAGGEVPGGSYEVGVYQPAILVITQDFKPLFSFASVPSLSNAGGAAGRPTAKIVMKVIHEMLNSGTSKTSSDWKPAKIPPFVPIILVMYFFANGNFVKPVPPALAADGTNPPGVKRFAVIKLVAAMACTLVLACLSPMTGLWWTSPVTGLCVLGYLAYVYVVWGTWIRDFYSPKADRNALQQPLMAGGTC